MELKIIEPLVAPALDPDDDAIALCGFGVIAAAARTADLLALRKPDRVFLLGIAGAIGNTLSIGKASVFSEVACYGLSLIHI